MPRILVFEGYQGFGATSVPVLTLGSKGTAVREVQTHLRALGYKGKDGLPIVVDGDFGQHTLHAVTQFQMNQSGLTLTGVIDSATRTALRTEYMKLPVSGGEDGQPSAGGMSTGMKVVLGLGLAYALKKMVLG